MIAEKINNVTRRLDKLEYLVSPEVWKLIGLALEELTDAAKSAVALEHHQGPARPGLTIIDIFAEPDNKGRLRVDPARMGVLFGDLAEAFRDVAEQGTTHGGPLLAGPAGSV